MWFNKPVPIVSTDVNWQSTGMYYSGKLDASKPEKDNFYLKGPSGKKLSKKEQDAALAKRVAPLKVGGLGADLEEKDLVRALDSAASYVARIMMNFKGTTDSSVDADAKDGYSHWKSWKNCDKGWWKELGEHLEDDKDLEWGIVDEAVFVNARVTDHDVLVMHYAEEGELMYGGTICANYHRTSKCFQFGLPAALVDATEEATDQDGKPVKPRTLEWWDMKDHKKQVRVNARAKNLKCVTGTVDASVMFFFQKGISRIAYQNRADVAAIKCAGEPRLS